MDRVYHLSTCSTCQRILKELPPNSLQQIDIKQQPLSESEVDELAAMAGSYEALFSRKAMLYKSLGLKDQVLSESDYRKYLLHHYTFLSRPVFVIGGKVYIGNRAATIENVKSALS